jgi:hypothetical protein
MSETLEGWWTGRRFANIGDSYFDCTWASQALTLKSLGQGGVVYDASIEGVMRAENLRAVVAKFEALGGRVLFEGPAWRGDVNSRLFLVWENSCVGLWVNDGDLEGRVVSTDQEFFLKSQAILEEAIGPKASAGRAYVLMSTESGPKLQSIGVASVPLERDNYNPAILEDFDAVVSDLKSSNPSGRLAIFDGIPGTGKTYMVRGLLSAVQDALFVLVPANLIQTLADPGMINALLETRRNKGNLPTVFLVEDADDCLGSRDSSNVNAVSALLNLGDGIIGAMMDIRLVCTTNLRNEELDEAVTRPGRLSRKIHVGHLERGVAENLYQKLTGKKVRIDEKLTLAQVYSLARGDGWKPVERKRAMGFGAQSGISPSSIQELERLGIDVDQVLDD